MKRTRWIAFFTTIFLIVICMPLQTMAARGCTGYDLENFWIDVVKTAPGTKYNATLTIYYSDSDPAVCSGLTDMHFFLRVEGNTVQAIKNYEGSEIFSFDGIAECIQYQYGGSKPPSEAYADQAEAAFAFLKYVVNPGIYAWNNLDDFDGCDPDSLDPDQVCPSFAVKEISKVVEDQLNYQKFMIMNLILAIVE